MFSATNTWARAALLLLSASTAGCYTTVHLKDGSTIRGTIEGSTADEVHIASAGPVRKADTPKQKPGQPLAITSGTTLPEGHVAVPRDRIIKVSHRGFAAGVAGSVLSGVGLAFMTTGIAIESMPQSDGKMNGVFHLLMTAPGAIVLLSGLGTMVPGWVMYADSKSALEGPQPGIRAKAQVVPMVVPTEQTTHYGLGVQGHW